MCFLLLCQDIVISGVFAFLFFCLAISTAVYGGRFGVYEKDYFDKNLSRGFLGNAADLNSDMGGVSVSVCTQYRQYCVLLEWFCFQCLLRLCYMYVTTRSQAQCHNIIYNM